MNIDSTGFKTKYKNLLKMGYCPECIAILTAPLTKGKLCKKCNEILLRNFKNGL